MQESPHYENIVEEVFDFLRTRRDALIEAGLSQEHICLDPGIGFGKTLAHNFDLLQHIDVFHRLGCPLLVGHSRKGFIGKTIQAETKIENIDREAGTLGVSLALASQGVQILRVHDTGITQQALLLFAASGGFPRGC